MSVKNRIKAIRLMEKIQKNPQLASKLEIRQKMIIKF